MSFNNGKVFEIQAALKKINSTELLTTLELIIPCVFKGIRPKDVIDQLNALKQTNGEPQITIIASSLANDEKWRECFLPLAQHYHDRSGWLELVQLLSDLPPAQTIPPRDLVGTWAKNTNDYVKIVIGENSNETDWKITEDSLLNQQIQVVILCNSQSRPVCIVTLSDLTRKTSSTILVSDIGSHNITKLYETDHMINAYKLIWETRSVRNIIVIDKNECFVGVVSKAETLKWHTGGNP